MLGHLNMLRGVTKANLFCSPLNPCSLSDLNGKNVKGTVSPLLGICRPESSRSSLHSPGSNKRHGTSRAKEPRVLRAAISGITEILRVFSLERRSPDPPIITEKVILVIDDVVDALREDYARSYFLTGEFLDSLYTEDCVFADPTIQFSGRDLYKRNLKLLVPFYEDPLLTLENIQQDEDGDSRFVETSWKLRVYIKLPWRPFIAVDGRTKYNLNAENKIVEHVESWNVTAKEALGQIFKPSERALWMTSKS
ncbi:hypothetical protein Mapa_007130 [Marchantia paleacea]|nr:hypothetical protein Mapa_007130 [Marchantia paleacea]